MLLVFVNGVFNRQMENKSKETQLLIANEFFTSNYCLGGDWFEVEYQQRCQYNTITLNTLFAEKENCINIEPFYLEDIGVDKGKSRHIVSLPNLEIKFVDICSLTKDELIAVVNRTLLNSVSAIKILRECIFAYCKSINVHIGCYNQLCTTCAKHCCFVQEFFKSLLHSTKTEIISFIESLFDGCKIDYKNKPNILKEIIKNKTLLKPYVNAISINKSYYNGIVSSIYLYIELPSMRCLTIRFSDHYLPNGAQLPSGVINESPEMTLSLQSILDYIEQVDNMSKDEYLLMHTNRTIGNKQNKRSWKTIVNNSKV